MQIKISRMCAVKNYYFATFDTVFIGNLKKKLFTEDRVEKMNLKYEKYVK